MIGNYLHIVAKGVKDDDLEYRTIKIKIPQNYDESTVKINYYNPLTDEWEILNTTIEGNFAVAKVAHFSIYALSGVETTKPSTNTVESSSNNVGGGGGGGGSPSPITLISDGAGEMTSTTYTNVLTSLSAAGKLNKDKFVETSNTLAGSLLISKQYPLPTDSNAASFARTVTKITGDVYALTAEGSQDNNFLYGALENKLVIARGDLGVDSMAAVVYAKAKNIPILLVKPNELPSVTEDAISSFMEIRQREIIIIGGEAAVSKAVEEKLATKGKVKRIFGETRIETAVALAKATFTDKNKVRVIIVTDYENPQIDAVLMSYVMDAPLLYVKKDKLSPLVKDYLKEHKETMFGPTKVILMGLNPEVTLEINKALE